MGSVLRCCCFAVMCQTKLMASLTGWFCEASSCFHLVIILDVAMLHAFGLPLNVHIPLAFFDLQDVANAACMSLAKHEFKYEGS